MSLKDLDCDKVRKLEDIQTEGRYTDPSGENNPRDRKLVSCLQTHYKSKLGIEEEYNELEYIINTNFSEYKEDELLYKALCECCKEKERYKKSTNNFREILTTQRARFVDCVQKRITRLQTDKLLDRIKLVPEQ